MTRRGFFSRASVLMVVACAACNTTSPAKDVSRDEVDARVVETPVASAPTPRASTGGGAECTADADCRTVSSYCNERPCACLVFAKGTPAPSCAGPSSVRCLVDPCRGKSAACQDGKCVLVSGSTQ